MKHGVIFKDFETGQTIEMSLSDWEKCKHTNKKKAKATKSPNCELKILRKKIVEAIKSQKKDLSIIAGEPCNNELSRIFYSVHNVASIFPCCLTNRRVGIVDIYAEYCDKCFMPAWDGEARASKFVEFVNLYFADLEDKK